MAFIPRLFVRGGTLASGATLRIEGADANHVRNVLRIPVGGEVLICDGAHRLFTATVTASGEDGPWITVLLGDEKADDGEFSFSVTVYQCLPKGEKTDAVIQKSVELGATEIVLVKSERCVARPDEKTMQKKLVRWQKIAESAAAQCGRSILPQVRGLLPYADACAEAANADCAFLCYEDEREHSLRAFLEEHTGARHIAFLIGPEGGISPSEVETAKACGLTSVSLGNRILRTETAPLFVLSAINVLCQ